jgi:hypothetical protein
LIGLQREQQSEGRAYRVLACGDVVPEFGADGENFQEGPGLRVEREEGSEQRQYAFQSRNRILIVCVFTVKLRGCLVREKFWETLL